MSRPPKKAAPFVYEDRVPVTRIFLALHNPRHEPVETEPEAILRLCEKEDVLPLARDIVRNGLSPLERFALTPIGGKRGSVPSYYVEEGNRRLCAMKLLADPDLAPAKMRASFEKLSETWTPVTHVPGVVFHDNDTLRTWLDRVHSGSQGGIGRRNWDAEQKQRFSGGTKNRLAQAVLDYAEKEGMISKEDREGKLTTAQRWLNPEVFQETLGIDRSNPGELCRTRPKAEFDAMLRRFMKDLVEGEEVTSRKNKKEIVEYARKLGTMPGISTTRVEPEPVVAEPQPPRKPARRKPRKPIPARHVLYDDGIQQALRALGNEKLERLYYSICQVELADHTILVCVGAWSFLESLTAAAGRNEGSSFSSYLSKGKLGQMGLGSSTQSIRAALDRIAECGNTTKHHPVAATFNGDQLNNDMITLREVILKCVEEATARLSQGHGRA